MNEAFRLPPFAGSMMRGVMGWALKEVCDPATYAYLFETESDSSGGKDAARPFILVPPIGARRLSPGQKFTSELRLLGKGCDYLAEFTEAIMLAGEFGLGKERATFELTKILVHDGIQPWVAYDRAMGWDDAYMPLPCALGAFVGFLPEQPTELTVTFMTPTRLIFQGERAQQPDFHLLARAAFRRVKGLLARHAQADELPSLQEDLDQLLAIQAQHNVEWVDWERTSNRQKRRHVMGGFVGSSTYYGLFQTEWLRLLKAGQILHLGKATTFGMGAYHVEIRGIPLPSAP